MGETLRQTPPNTFPIPDISDRAKEARAVVFDQGGKGYLTYDELIAWYQSENAGRLPTLRDMGDFLGVQEHVLRTEHLAGWEALQSQWLATDWKGDFHVVGFTPDPSYRPAGNVRTGRHIGTEWTPENVEREVDRIVFLVDFDLISKQDFDNRVRSAVLVIGPTEFPREYEGAPYGERVEVPLTLYSQDAYQTFNRFGPSGWVPEEKLMVAHVDTADLRKLAGESGGLSFYFRIETNDRRALYINKDGRIYSNFTLSPGELAPPGRA